MRPSRLRLLFAVLSLGVLAATFAQLASAAEGGDDVILTMQVGQNGHPSSTTKTTGLNFQLFFNVDTTVGIVQPVTLTVGLPNGLHWGADGPDPADGCRGTAPAVCTITLGQNAAGTVGGVWRWDVVADQPGAYEVTAAVTPALPDSNTSNNSAAFAFQVTQPASGKSTGSGSVSASRARVTPARPRAGSVVSATVRLAGKGKPARPSGIVCTAKLGSTPLHGKATATAGAATCRYATPRAAEGKVLRGTISFRAGSARITRRFATRLG
jgi:hypothetical protein